MPDSNAPRREKARMDAQASLGRMQNFDVSTLPRTDELGVLNFKEATEPATRLIALYNQLNQEVLESLPIGRLNKIKEQADADYSRLDEILKFEPGTPKTERDRLVQALYEAYDPAFERLAEVISYAVRRSTDFEKLGRDARAVIQGVKDDAEKIRKDLADSKKEADSTLDAIKRVAAEQGVSQQATYFNTEGDEHSTASHNWLKATVVMTCVLAIYAFASLFMHRIEWIKPTNTFESVQLSVSKALIFATIFFMLFLCARNYLAHRHNAVVNRHRRNALATYTALVKAANAPANSDIVLNKAADCIFTPQPTGYSKGGPESGSMSLLTVGPNSLKGAGI